MKAYLLFRLLLALHIAGIVVMAGATMIDFLTFKTFWQFADAHDPRVRALVPLMAKYGAFIRAGAVTLILTGIALFILGKGAIWSQVWFKVKMALVVVLVISGIFVGNKKGHQLRETVMAHGADFAQYTTAIRESMSRFYPLQLSLFFLLILVSMLRSSKA